MSINPFDHHCGPFNSMLDKPTNPIDAVCYKHDVGYSKEGKLAYLNPWSKSDGDFVHDMTQLIDSGKLTWAQKKRATKYRDFFVTKGYGKSLSKMYNPFKKYSIPLEYKQSSFWNESKHEARLKDNVTYKRKVAPKFKPKSSIRSFGKMVRYTKRRKSFRKRKRRTGSGMSPAQFLSAMYPPQKIIGTAFYHLRGTLKDKEMGASWFCIEPTETSASTVKSMRLVHGSNYRYNQVMYTANQISSGAQVAGDWDNNAVTFWPYSSTAYRMHNPSNVNQICDVFEVMFGRNAIGAENGPLKMFIDSLNDAQNSDGYAPNTALNVSRSVGNPPFYSGGSDTTTPFTSLHLPEWVYLKHAGPYMKGKFKVIRHKRKMLGPGGAMHYKQISRYGKVLGETFTNNRNPACRFLIIRLRPVNVVSINTAVPPAVDGVGIPDACLVVNIKTVDVVRTYGSTPQKKTLQWLKYSVGDSTDNLSVFNTNQLLNPRVPAQNGNQDVGQ